MRAEIRKTLQPINVLLAFLGVQGVLLAWAPECAAVLALSAAAACGLGYLGYRRFDRPELHRQALRESEAHYASFVASLREGILVRERDGAISACNPGAERVFGLPQESVLGRTTLLPDVQYVNPDGTPFDVARQPGDLALTTGRPADDVEFGIVRPDGSMKWVVASARPLFREGESIAHAAVVSLNDISERRAAEHELERQRTFLRTVLDSVSSVIFVRDREQRYVFVNRALAELYGTTPKPMIGRKLVDFNPDREQALSLERSDRRLLEQGGEVVPYELLIIASSGEKRWFHMVKRVISDARGEPNLVLGIGADITERKRLQEEVQKALEVRDTILENSIVSIVFLNNLGRAVWANRAAEQMFGFDRGEVVGKSIESFYLSHEAYIATGGAVSKATLERRAYEAELRMRRSDGTVLWVHLSGKAVSPADLSQGTVWVVVDITERKRAEDRLRESEARFRSLTELSADWYWEQDENLRFVESSIDALDGALERLNMTRDEAIGKTRWEVHPAGVAETQWAAHKADLEARRPFRDFEITRIDRDGNTVYVNISGIPIFDAQGAFKGYRGVGRNITERKRAEAQLRHMNEELEKRVAERTAQLEASVEELEAYSYTISHDLRAPLRAIDGFSQILIEEARGGLEPQARACLDRISQNARHMAELIDRLLAFARFSRTPLERRAIDLAALVQSVIDEQPREGREIEFGIAPLHRCLADAQLLRQVFGNLVSNAVKYTRPREMAKIEIGSLERDGATVYFVRDNGVGFDMTYVHKLFGVFQRLHSDKEFEGAGAGLAIVQRIVARHGGRAWAEGEVGKGATFYFTLGGEALAAAA